MAKKTMKKVTTIMIIGSGIMSLGVIIIKCGPIIVDMMKKKITPTMKLDDLPKEEPSIIWEECEEG